MRNLVKILMLSTVLVGSAMVSMSTLASSLYTTDAYDHATIVGDLDTDTGILTRNGQSYELVGFEDKTGQNNNYEFYNPRTGELYSVEDARGSLALAPSTATRLGNIAASNRTTYYDENLGWARDDGRGGPIWPLSNGAVDSTTGGTGGGSGASTEGSQPQYTLGGGNIAIINPETPIVTRGGNSDPGNGGGGDPVMEGAYERAEALERMESAGGGSGAQSHAADDTATGNAKVAADLAAARGASDPGNRGGGDYSGWEGMEDYTPNLSGPEKGSTVTSAKTGNDNTATFEFSDGSKMKYKNGEFTFEDASGESAPISREQANSIMEEANRARTANASDPVNTVGGIDGSSGAVDTLKSSIDFWNSSHPDNQFTYNDNKTFSENLVDFAEHSGDGGHAANLPDTPFGLGGTYSAFSYNDGYGNDYWVVTMPDGETSIVMTPEEYANFRSGVGEVDGSHLPPVSTPGIDSPTDPAKADGPWASDKWNPEWSISEGAAIDPLRLVMQILTALESNDDVILREDVNIRAGENEAAEGAVESSALQNTDPTSMIDEMTTAANYPIGAAEVAKTLLTNATVDVDNLLKEDNITGASGEATPDEKAREITRRRTDLLRQYSNAAIQISEGMNAISSRFMDRATRMTEAIASASTEAAAYGVAQDAGRYVLLETLRGLALTSAQMGVQAARLLNEYEVEVEGSNENNQ